jgi:hypothetical protein
VCFVIVVCRVLVFVLGKLGSKRNLCLVWLLVKCESVGCGWIYLTSMLPILFYITRAYVDSVFGYLV